MRLISHLPALMLALAVSLVPPTVAEAQQGLFSPRLTVNGRAITEYELQQRMKFMELLRTPGDIAEAAEVALIEDRLRMDAADAMGIKLTDQQILEGMKEFASRADLSVEEFVEAIGQGGVEPETFRDFVEAGLVWREVIRAKFGPRVQVTDADVDRALSLSSKRGFPPSVLVSEIAIKVYAHKEEETQALAERLAATLRGEAAFAAAAKEYSAAPTAEEGGDLGWMSSVSLPPPARAALQGLRPGQVSQPLRVGDMLVIYYLRDLREGGQTAPEGAYVEYAEFLIPGGRSAAALEEAARVRARVDACDDLYGIAKGLPEDRLTITSMPAARLSPEVARELELLDEGESSTALTRGDALVFLMLCNRQAGPAEEIPSREATRTALANERLNGYSESYMSELMAEALIRYARDEEGG
ncbi:peptidylprolyl isomerase [Ostreiculturibacter nitratireducens]